MRLNSNFVGLVTIGCLILLLTAAVSDPKPGLLEIVSKLIAYTRSKPAEKIFVHVDRTQYTKGETIWFSAYVVNAPDFSILAQSEIVYVELLDGKNRLVDRKTLLMSDGHVAGDFQISDSAANGAYAVRAYTNYMKNFDEAWFFNKAISVISPGAKNEITAPASRPVLRFFAEGGTFVAGLESNLAFKCVDGEGDDVEVRGKIFDTSGKLILPFETTHAGMGVVKFTPLQNTSYLAKIELDGDTLTYKLPEAETAGYSLRVKDLKDSLRISVVTNDKAQFDHGAFLVMQSNGVPHFSARGKFSNGAFIAYVKKSFFPTGVAQISLLDEDLVPRCERLVFIAHAAPRIEADFDKKIYRKREKVTVRGHVVDGKGAPLRGHFSVSVVDADAESSVEKYPANIKSTLLLTSDLRGVIRDPAYYFKDDHQITHDHLDLLMMVHGWRRFTWKEALADSSKLPAYLPEKGLRIGGKIAMRPKLKKKEITSNVKILTPDAGVILMKTNSLGEFSTDELIYYDSAELILETDDIKGQPRDISLELFAFTPSPPSTGIPTLHVPHDPFYFLNQIDNNRRIMNAIRLEQGNTMLGNVLVKASRITNEAKDEVTSMNPMGKPNNRLTSDQLPDGYVNILEAMIGRMPGVAISGNLAGGYSIIIRGATATVLMDGARVDANFLSTVNKNDIDRIDVVKDIGYGSAMPPILAVFSRHGSLLTTKAPGIHKIKYPGLYRAREFYSPDFSVENKLHAYPDFRTTVYWNPTIQTDAYGNFEFSFYSADAITTYRLTVEGMTDSKFPITAAAITRIDQ